MINLRPFPPKGLDETQRIKESSTLQSFGHGSEDSLDVDKYDISSLSPPPWSLIGSSPYTYTLIIQDIMYSLIFLRRKNAIHFAMAPVVRTEIFFSWRMVLFDLPIRDSPTNAITYGCPFQSI